MLFYFFQSKYFSLVRPEIKMSVLFKMFVLRPIILVEDDLDKTSDFISNSSFK